MKTFTWPKILMLIGAAWIILIGILSAAGVAVSLSIYGWGNDNVSVLWPLLLVLGILYILVPFSVKPGIWSFIWGSVITGLAVIFLIGFFVSADYKSVWTYLGAIPNLLIGVGALGWVLIRK
ncbi:hypothetical protein SSYRP_v1c09510 [Spiroplasma syrphidicola EA-1]|uniref:Transmembrane protein n=1 Tax=Spiroplasma syrphidicola EA-1 TaxID=1276229 RepID=R4U7A6_9MOLU|nr:hypothetical protein [Spiroplasma syrphidicola]AGM26538.1 hypothetical protein SSYRP_v1c09510 [Spiroplasma syrphidicola EA-1]